MTGALRWSDEDDFCQDPLAAARGAWQVEEAAPEGNRSDPAPPIVRAFTPRSVQMLMSDSHLERCGLRVMQHETRSWLVSVDADTLVDARPSDGWWDAVAARVAALETIAAEEGLTYSCVSAAAALAFARNLNATCRPSAFLVGNGNVRLLWVDGVEQIGLQFKDGGAIQYVMFAERGGRRSTHMGEDDAGGILRQITAAGLRHLLARR